MIPGIDQIFEECEQHTRHNVELRSLFGVGRLAELGVCQFSWDIIAECAIWSGSSPSSSHSDIRDMGIH